MRAKNREVMENKVTKTGLVSQKNIKRWVQTKIELERDSETKVEVILDANVFVY